MDLPPAALSSDESDGVDRPAELDGLRRLWARVLVQALTQYWLAPSSSVRFKESQKWLFHAHSGAANSFENVCELLGFNPVQVRAIAARRCSEFRADPSRAESMVRDMQLNGFKVER